MKTASALFAAALILASTSCDKHSWEETKVLHENMNKDHGHGADAHAAPHGEAKKDEHAASAHAPAAAPAHAPAAAPAPATAPAHAPAPAAAPAAAH